MWRADEIVFVLLDDATAHPVATAEVQTPAGRIVVMAEPRMEGRVLVLRGLHMHGEGCLGRAGAVGLANLRVLADAAMEVFDLDGILVQGALRVSGAGPGHRPRPLRFARRLPPGRRA